MVSGLKVTVLCGLGGFEDVGEGISGVLSVEAEAIAGTTKLLDQVSTTESHFRKVLRYHGVYMTSRRGMSKILKYFDV